MKVKVLVPQLCPTLCDPMHYSMPGSSIHGILQARIPESVAIFLLQGIFPTQGSKPGLLHCRRTLYQLSYQGSPMSVNHMLNISEKEMVTHSSVLAWRIPQGSLVGCHLWRRTESDTTEAT